MESGTKRLAVGVLLVVAASMAQGCCTHEMAPRNVVVMREGSSATAELNLIAANDTDLPRLAQRNLDEYWKVDVLRGNAPADRYIIKFGGGTRSGKLEKSDAIWQKWRAKQAKWLVAIAFIPELSQWTGTVESDPRRIILPLDKCRWENPDADIHMIIAPSGLTSQPQPKPEKD